jgi:hypothetical protein
MLSLAIKADIDVFALSQTEMAYCPMVADRFLTEDESG